LREVEIDPRGSKFLLALGVNLVFDRLLVHEFDKVFLCPAIFGEHKDLLLISFFRVSRPTTRKMSA